jgi:hypothetical protein
MTNRSAGPRIAASLSPRLALKLAGLALSVGAAACAVPATVPSGGSGSPGTGGVVAQIGTGGTIAQAGSGPLGGNGEIGPSGDAPSSPGGATTPGADADAGASQGSPGGAPATAMTSESDGSTADAGADCDGADPTALSIGVTGAVLAACNDASVAGQWACFVDSDGPPGNDCAAGRTPFVAGSGMCVSGTLPATFSAHAGIALDLTGDGDGGTYNAQRHGVVGFAITIAGTTNGAELRFGFNGPNAGSSSSYTPPFVSEPGPDAGGTTYDVPFADAVVPPGWSVDDPGATVDPTAVAAVLIEISGQTSGTEPYGFCVTAIRPILAGASPTCGLASGTICGVQDIAEEVGDYAIQNNTNGNLTGQCIRAASTGTCGAAFDVTFPSGSFGNGGNTPSSFPSVIYGWQNGVFYGSYQTPVRVSAIQEVPTTWSYTAPGGTYDAAYDVWFGAGPTGLTPTTELMIWVGDSGPQPAGSDTNRAVSIGGGSWEVWKGTVSSWPYLAYRAKSPSAAATVSLDLAAFIKDAVANEGLPSTSYLWGLQAGFEIYRASGTFSTTAFSVSVQ